MKTNKAGIDRDSQVKVRNAPLLSCIILALFLSASASADVINDLVPVIIQAESGGNPNAVSKDGSYGLMQISNCVLQDFNAHGYDSTFWNIGDLYNPKKNIEVGTWYLHRIQSWLPNKYKNSRKHIVFAYNVGIGRLKQLNYQIPKWCKKHPNKIYRSIFNEKE